MGGGARAVVHHDRIRGRGLLEPGGEVHGFPGDHEFPGGRSRGVGDDFPRADADADVHLADLRPQLGHAALHRDRGPHRPLRVVLMRLREAEHGHDRVAHELFHGAAVPGRLFAHGRRELAEDPAHRLGIHPARQGRRSDDVREDDADEAPFGRFRPGERRAAG